MMHIYSIVYDNADFLELQYLSFRKNYSGQLDFTVINNTNSLPVLEKTKKFASLWSWNVVDTLNPRFDNAGLSHQRALQTAVLVAKDELSVIVDPDIFVAKSLDSLVTQIQEGSYVFCGLEQGTVKVKYLWPGFFMFNNPPHREDIDLRGALINEHNFDDFIVPDPASGWTWDLYEAQSKTRIPTDSGGLLCRYISKYSSKVLPLSLDFVRESCYDPTIIPEHLQREYKDLYNFWIIGGKIIHTGRLSNWDLRPAEEVQAKNRLVKSLVEHYVYTNNANK